MSRRLSTTAVFCFSVMTTASPAALAQRGLDIFVTPIPNAPFSGTIHVERSFIQPDGAVRNIKTIRNIARDTQGRIYNESRNLVPASSTETPKITAIHLYDPQTRISATISPMQKTFWTGLVNRPPAMQPPALLYASPAGATLPKSEFVKEEDLGTVQIQGLPARGVRETQTIPAEMSATGKSVITTDEYWYSDDLRIYLVLKHNDPRASSVSMTVSEINPSEPDPALFKIPDDYKHVGGQQIAGQ